MSENTFDDMTDRGMRIFNAAIVLFSKKGFSATTTKEIAEAAGVAEGTIFRYYKTKKSILDAIVQNFIEMMGDVAIRPVEEIFEDAENKDLKQMLHDLLMDRIDFADKYYPVISIVLTEILFHDDLKEILYENLIKRGVEDFTNFHAAMVARGLMRGDIPAEAVIRSVFGNFLIFIAQFKLFPRTMTREDMEKEFETIFDVILNGVTVARN